MPTGPLPAPLTEGGFTFAAARAYGESSGSLRRRGLHRVVHGVHSANELDGVDRLRALLLALPEPVAYSHLTSARLHDLPLTSRQQEQQRVDLTRPTRSAQIRRPDVRGHRGLESRLVVRREGLPVIDAADTWCDFGELTRRDRLTIEDLVVVGDAAANVILRPEHTAYDLGDRRPQWRTDETLAERLEARREAQRIVQSRLAARLAARNRPRGKVVLSQALPLIRPGVRSPMETRARLVLMQGGLPEPWVNLDIYTDEGQWLAEGDLVWPARKVVGEYQGAHHADRLQASRDSARRQVLEDHGWTVHEIWAEDLFDWSRRVAMVARFGNVLGRPVE